MRIIACVSLPSRVEAQGLCRDRHSRCRREGMWVQRSVTGNGPLEFTNAKGQQISIPLSALYFDPSGTLQVDSVWATASGLKGGSGLLAYVQSEGLITPAPAPSPFPAMIIKAADPGTGGNNITVQITDVSPAADPTQTTFTIVVTEVDTYTGLTAASIERTIGSSKIQGSSLVSVTTGSMPGLVQVESGSVDINGIPDSLSDTLDGNPATLDVDGDGSPAIVFTLLAKKTGADGALTQVQILPDTTSPPTSGATTFTLTATWTKTVTGVNLTNLQTLAQNELGYEITVSLPASGAYSVPAAATSTLSGGTTGSPASATLSTGI